MAPGSAADGTPIADLPCGENAWVSLVIRDGILLTGVTGDTILAANDDVLILADPEENEPLSACFTIPAAPGET